MPTRRSAPSGFKKAMTTAGFQAHCGLHGLYFLTPLYPLPGLQADFRTAIASFMLTEWRFTAERVLYRGTQAMGSQQAYVGQDLRCRPLGDHLASV